MVLKLESLFIEQLEKCPIEFKNEFRKIYQQLKIVDKPTEVKGIFKNKLSKKNYKLIIDESRISLNYEEDILTFVCFYFNQYFNGFEQD
jgi:hypothetical protein